MKMKKKYQQIFLVLMVSLGLNVVFFLYFLKQSDLLTKLTTKETAKVTKPKDNLFDDINPEKGFEINASSRNLGPKMIALGVIDYDKFKSTYEKSGQPLPKDLDEMLTKGSDRKVRITRDNSYFLLNFFWAVGLANKSKILDEGDMIKYGGIEGAGNFASTGGWSLAKSSPMNYYSKDAIIPLTPQQEELVDKVSANVYRPCCNNPTSFPDCNHGMALLGVFQLMAANGATENQMYEAAKYFNAFWFPSNYYDLALYFKNKEGKRFSQISGQVILGKDYSSASGWRNIKTWLTNKGLEEAPPKQGGGCGV